MKRVLAIGLCLWLVLCSPAWATFTLTASKTQATGTANPTTMSFDCAGADLLVLAICEKDTASPYWRNGTAPTYNGVAMTDSGQGVILSGGTECAQELWFLVSPASGSNTISIPNPSLSNIVPIATGWTGCDTGDPLDTSAHNDNAGSANPSCLITTAAANELIIDGMTDGYASVPTANSHTLISSQDNGVWTSNAQYTTDDGTGGITLSWTVASDDWAMIVIAMNPAGGAAERRIFIISGFDFSPHILILLLAAVHMKRRKR